MPEWTLNALGRKVPLSVNGFDYEPYRSAWEPMSEGPLYSAPTVREWNMGRSKVVSDLVSVVDSCVPDGGWISFPHYYRDDPTALALVVDALRAAGKRGVKILGNAFFNSHDAVLGPALEEGVIEGFEGNCYGAVARRVGKGALVPWTVVGRSHGGRARVFQRGERVVDLAVAPVPIADRWGNANGVMGHPSSLCGPISLFEPDARWAKRTVLLAERIHPGLLAPHPIDMRMVDYVVPVERAGDNRGIATGTTDIRRVKGDPVRRRIADNVTALIRASGVVRDGFNFQIGSGSGLLVLDNVLAMMREKGIRAGFTTGGSMEFHCDLLEEGLVDLFLDGQCFEPSMRLFHSLLNDPRHVEISTSFYYSPAAKDAAVNLMDVVVLGCSEIDVDFNVNTVTGYDGVLRTGIGGGPDAAAGGSLTVFALPMARVNRKGRSCPCVRERVTTVVTPGEVVDAVVTEECAALNPASSSPWLDAVRENARSAGLEIVSIEELAARAAKKAAEIGTLMDEPHFTDEPVFVVEWRDGRLIDVVWKLEE